VMIQAEADIDEQLAQCDRILNVERVLVDVPRIVEIEELPVAGQIERSKSIRPILVRLEPGTRALTGICQVRIADRVAVAIKARRIERWIRHAESEILQQPRLLQVEPVFYVVTSAQSRDLGANAPVHQLAALALRGGRVVKEIRTGVVIKLIFPNVGIDRQQRMRAESMLISGCEAPRENALALILGELIDIVRVLDPVARSEQI